ncbi:MAG: hypothetical protein AB8I08_06845 [Sandaracinaceae bacterium]
MSDGESGDTRDDLEAPFEVLPTQLHRSPPEKDPDGTGEVASPPAAAASVPESVPGEPGGAAVATPSWQEPEPGDEDKRTEFFDRDRLLRNRQGKGLEPTPSIIVDGASKAPPPRAVDAVTDRHMRPAPVEAPKKKGKGAIIAVVGLLCGVAGIGIGVSAAFLMGDDDPPEVASNETPARLESTPLGESDPPEPEGDTPETPEAPPEGETPEETDTPTGEDTPAAATDATDPPAPVETPAMLVEQIRAAIEEVNPEAAQETLERARPLIEARIARRLEAELMVMRGDGALSVERLTTLTESYDQDPVLFIALGRVLAQAEQDQAAQRAFQRAVELDSERADAHIGLAHIRARSFALPAARRHLRDARTAAEVGTPSDRLSARLKAVEAAIALESGDRDEATRLAQQALDLDSACAEASVLMARVAIARGANPDRALRAALSGRAPGPVAIGMLAARVEGTESCDLATRYLARAPRGFDASAMRRITNRC